MFGGAQQQAASAIAAHDDAQRRHSYAQRHLSEARDATQQTVDPGELHDLARNDEADGAAADGRGGGQQGGGRTGTRNCCIDCPAGQYLDTVANEDIWDCKP